MNNFIELNVKHSRTTLLTVDNESHLRALGSNLSLFPDERIDMPTKRLFCISCGVRNDTKPIAINGYCKSCNELIQSFNI